MRDPTQCLAGSGYAGIIVGRHPSIDRLSRQLASKLVSGSKCQSKVINQPSLTPSRLAKQAGVEPKPPALWG
jgi:hypothetical protein